MKSRLRASAVHLLFSALVILVFLGFVYFIWYPYPFDDIHAVFDAVHILVGVDLVLGPIMTLIIFDTLRKSMREIKRDIAVIVAVQISALVWGIHATYSVRPEFAVIYKEAIHSIARGDIDPETLPEDIAYPGFLDRPKLVYIPTLEPGQAMELVSKMMSEGKLVETYQIAELYRPASQFVEEISAQALNGEDLASKADSGALSIFKNRAGAGEENYLFFPVIYSQFRAILALDRKNLDMKAMIPLKSRE